MSDDLSTPLDESSSGDVFPPGGAEDLERLADLDDMLGGHADDDAGAPIGETPPEGLDAILLLRQWAAEERGDDPAADQEIPRRIGRFAIVREVGRGGFARVYEAFDTRLRRRVALKVARPEVVMPPGARRRFVREAELAARLDHPHIVTIHDAGEADGHVYIAEEYCAGGSLGQWLEGHPGPVPPRVAARVVQALAGAVAHSHGFCILHRDIKPANVLLVTGESGPLPADAAGDHGARLDVKLADFGLGKLAGDGASAATASDLTRADSRLGTPAWMAPEQVDRALGPVGPASDIHALGLLLDRLLTGRCAHAGGDDAESMRLVVAAEPVSPDRIARGVPADLAAVTLKCLAKRPSERYAAAADLAGDLARFLDGRPTVARPVSPVERAIRLARRHRPLVAASLLAIGASLVALAAIALRWHERDLLAARAAEVRGHQAAATLRRGFEAWRAGDVPGALLQIDTCRGLDGELADSLAGRWLRARLHGEEAILLGPPGRDAGEERPIDLHTIAVAPDGGRVAVGGADGRLSLLGLATDGAATLVRQVVLHDEINDVAFHPDGRLVATVGQDGRMCVGDTVDGSIVRSWSVGEGPLFGVAWSPDGRTLACGGVGRSVHLFAVDGGEAPVAVLRPLEDLVPAVRADAEIEALLFVRPGLVAVACGNRVVLHDVAANRVVHDLASRDGTVAHLALSPDGSRLVSAGSDRVPRVWNVERGSLVAALPIHPSWVAGCRFAPDGRHVVTGCRDGVVRVCPIGSEGEAAPLVGHRGRVWDVDVLPDGRVVSVGSDGTLRRWAVGATQERAGIREVSIAGGGLARAVALAAPGSRGDVVVASRDPAGIARLDSEGLPVAEIAPAFSGQWQLEIDERRGRMAASGADFRVATATLPDRGTAAAPRVLPAEIVGSAIAWSGDAGLLVGGMEGRLWLWDDASARALVVDDMGRNIDAIDVTFAGSPRALVVAGKVVRLVDLSPSGMPRKGSARTLLELPGSTGSVRAVAWAPDGGSFVIGTNVGGVERYDAATGLSLGSFARHSRDIRSLEWSADGRTLVSADTESVRFSDVRTTTVFDELRPGWTIESARLANDDDGSVELVVAGNVGPSGQGGGRIAVATLPAP